MSILRLIGGFACVVGTSLIIAAPATAQAPAPTANPSDLAGDVVDVVEAAGVLDGPLTRFVIGAIQGAAEDGASAVVVQLDSQGALGGDVDALVAAIDTSPIPVVVYVGGLGARATGAAAEVAASAHVLALAPTSVYGVAHPADLGRPDAATVQDVADAMAAAGVPRGRDQAFLVAAAEGASVIAVPDGETGVARSSDTRLPSSADPDRAQTMDEQALLDAGIADIVAPTLQQVLAALDGIDVVTTTGPVTLSVDPVTANIRFINLNLAQRILHTASSPMLAYLLLLAGVLTLFFEIFQPGFGVSGFSAIGVLALGVYAVAVLPVSPLWAVVALLGILLLAYDLAIAGLSWPSALGTLLLGVGSFRMWAIPELTPPAWLLVVGTVSAAIFFILLMTSVLRAQGNQALLGAKSVEGKVGIVRSALGPEGHIFVGGALWRARAPEGEGKVRTGTRVRVLGLNDSLTLDVEVIEDPADAQVHSPA